jgi:hypothetical protein
LRGTTRESIGPAGCLAGKHAPCIRVGESSAGIAKALPRLADPHTRDQDQLLNRGWTVARPVYLVFARQAA